MKPFDNNLKKFQCLFKQAIQVSCLAPPASHQEEYFTPGGIPNYANHALVFEPQYKA